MKRRQTSRKRLQKWFRMAHCIGTLQVEIKSDFLLPFSQLLVQEMFIPNETARNDMK